MLTIIPLFIPAGPVIVPIVVPVDNSPARGQSGCLPPIEYAKQHSCELEFNSKLTANEFICGDVVLYGDCQGSYYKIDKLSFWEKEGTAFVFIAFIFIIIIFLIGIIIR